MITVILIHYIINWCLLLDSVYSVILMTTPDTHIVILSLFCLQERNVQLVNFNNSYMYIMYNSVFLLFIMMVCLQKIRDEDFIWHFILEPMKRCLVTLKNINFTYYTKIFVRNVTDINRYTNIKIIINNNYIFFVYFHWLGIGIIDI